jgi:protocatechuate 3,4-dioxygenase, beta subunit
MLKDRFGRRDFLKFSAAAAALPLLNGCKDPTLAQTSDNNILEKLRANAIKDPRNEWWGAIDVPRDVTSSTNLRGLSDTDDILRIYGVAFGADDQPAANVLIYFYHTDIYGIYGRDNEHRHGRYRGWVLTGPDGRYTFDTIRPASYPNSTIAAHIHMTVTTPDRKEDWIDSIVFEGDRFLTARDRAANRGGFDPVVRLQEKEKGVFTGVRKIRIL